MKPRRETWVTVVRSVVVLLAVTALPFMCVSYHTACNDPVAHWKAPDPAAVSIEQKYITQALPETHATYGMALTIDANTGQLLSYYRSGPPLRCADAWEPGSAMKPLTVAAALDTGSIDRNFTFYDGGSVTIAGQRIFNWAPFEHGEKNLETLLHDSLNVGAIAVVEQIKPHEQWYDYLQYHFMLDTAGQGSVPLADDPAASYRYAVSAFGIGVVTTPIRLSLAYAALVNGGIYHDICLENTCSPAGRRVLKSSTSAELKQLLSEIYPDYETSVPVGSTRGGKSGSAPMAQPTGEYYLGDDSGTYIGFIEHGNKTYIQVVRLDQPQGYAAASHATKPVWVHIADDVTKQM